MKSPASSPARSATSKAVLYCFDCGHESPVDGDWSVERAGDSVHYRCPDCGTTITSRPHKSRRPAESDGNRCYCSGD